tara:strand:+ start:315 stop:995 length:681 start_codon:yes stop_codon:yes gene_type:complete
MGIDLFYSRNSARVEKKDQEQALNQLSDSSPKSLSRQFLQDVQKPLRATQENLHNENKEVGESQTSLRFSLNYYFLNSQLAVLEEVPLSKSRFSHRDYLNLLRKILLALGVKAENQSFDVENISWPVAEGFATPADQESAARLMLFGFIRKKSQEANFANLLVFADSISDFFIRHKKTESIRDYFSETQGFHLTISQSLESMLIHPDLKKDAWQQLQPLRERITSS